MARASKVTEPTSPGWLRVANAHTSSCRSVGSTSSLTITYFGQPLPAFTENTTSAIALISSRLDLSSRLRMSRGTVRTIRWNALDRGLQAVVIGSPARRRWWRSSPQLGMPHTVWSSSGGSPATAIGRIGSCRCVSAVTSYTGWYWRPAGRYPAYSPIGPSRTASVGETYPSTTSSLAAGTRSGTVLAATTSTGRPQ